MNFILAVLVSSALAGLAWYKKALTRSGIVTSWLLCILISFFGGWSAYLILTATFIFVVAADKFAGKKADPNGIRQKSGARDACRVLCNVAFPALAMLLYGISRKELYLFVYTAVMAESLSDSLASKFGPLTKGHTFDICTFRETSPGLSGGISLYGCLAAIVGALIIGCMSALFRLQSCRYAIFAAMLGFSGCLFDSLLGSAIQVRYICPVCGKISERSMHCGVKAKVCKGLAPINNDVVNLCSNAFVFAVGIAAGLWM